MAGLLGDGWDSPQSQGLLALAAGMIQGNFGKGVADYGTTMAGAQEREMRRKFEQMRMASEKRKIDQEDAQMKEAARIKGLLAGAGQSFGATNQVNDALPADLRIGAQPALQVPMDYQRLIREGVPLEQVKALAESRNFGRDKVARTAEVEGPNGSKLVQGFDDYGQPVGQGAQGYVAPQLINQGDKQTFAKPMIGASFPMGMSPAERDASAGRWASHGLAKQRLSFDQSGGAGGKAPAGYRYLPNGNMEAVPGGPADLKAGQAGSQKATDAREALAVIAEAEKLIPQSTGSGLGAIVDSTAGFFGASPKGAQAGARLKAIEGMLVSKMPKMSGPQSDKDVLLYKQMAGQVGDTSLPVASRMAALETIKGIQMMYGGGAATPSATGTWSIEKAD